MQENKPWTSFFSKRIYLVYCGFHVFLCQTIRWFKNTEDFLLRVYQCRFAIPVILKLILDREQLRVLYSLPMHGHTRAHTQTHVKQSKPISQGGVRGQMSADFKKSDELAFCFEQKQQNLSNWCRWIKADVSRSVSGINKDFSLRFFSEKKLKLAASPIMGKTLYCH